MMDRSPLSKLILGDDREVLLPETRRQSFSFYGRLHFWSLLFFGVLTSVGFLPCLAWLYTQNYAKAQQLQLLTQGAADYEKQYNTVLMQHNLTDHLILIPLLAVFFVLLSGLFGIVKRMAFCQSSGCGEYFKAIKSNGLQSGICGIGFGVSLFLLSYNIGFYRISTLPSAIKGILAAVAILQFVFVTVMTVYLMCGFAVYTNTAWGHIRNAFRLTLGTVVPGTVVVGAVALPAVITWLIPAPFQLIPLALMPMFYVGFAVLALTCYCNSVFDRYINRDLGDEYVRIGLRKQKSNEE